MQITIRECRGYVEFAQSGFWAILADHDAREFRIDTTDNMDLHRRVLNLVMDLETKRTTEFWESAELEVEAIWTEAGAISTILEDGTVILVTTVSFSVFLPVNDDFEDQETHWVGAVPLLRKLLAH